MRAARVALEVEERVAAALADARADWRAAARHAHAGSTQALLYGWERERGELLARARAADGRARDADRARAAAERRAAEREREAERRVGEREREAARLGGELVAARAAAEHAAARCVACHDARRDVLLLPCNHFCVCSACAARMAKAASTPSYAKLTSIGPKRAKRRGKKEGGSALDPDCPVCRTRVEKHLKVFWS